MRTKFWGFTTLLALALSYAVEAPAAGLPPKVRVLAATNVRITPRS